MAPVRKPGRGGRRSGSGRPAFPTPPEWVPFCIRIEPDLDAALKAEAQARGMAIAALARELLRQGLEQGR